MIYEQMPYIIQYLLGNTYYHNEICASQNIKFYTNHVQITQYILFYYIILILGIRYDAKFHQTIVIYVIFTYCYFTFCQHIMLSKTCYIYLHTCIHIHTYIHKQTHTYNHKHTHTHTRTSTCKHKHIYTYNHTDS